MGERRVTLSAWDFVKPKSVYATTASGLTAEDWQRAWELAAPVVVAANRFVEAEKECNPALIEDAHFQLLRAVAEYKAAAHA